MYSDHLFTVSVCTEKRAAIVRIRHCTANNFIGVCKRCAPVYTGNLSLDGGYYYNNTHRRLWRRQRRDEGATLRLRFTVYRDGAGATVILFGPRPSLGAQKRPDARMRKEVSRVRADVTAAAAAAIDRHSVRTPRVCSSVFRETCVFVRARCCTPYSARRGSHAQKALAHTLTRSIRPRFKFFFSFFFFLVKYCACYATFDGRTQARARCLRTAHPLFWSLLRNCCCSVYKTTRCLRLRIAPRSEAAAPVFESVGAAKTLITRVPFLKFKTHKL